MIPTAQVLADILNDPAIPPEALPSFSMRCYVPLADDTGKVEKCVLVGTEHLVNAALYWSLSAWLWSKGVQTAVQPNLPCTPVDGMADLVRQWAAVLGDSPKPA